MSAVKIFSPLETGNRKELSSLNFKLKTKFKIGLKIACSDANSVTPYPPIVWQNNVTPSLLLSRRYTPPIKIKFLPRLPRRFLQ